MHFKYIWHFWARVGHSRLAEKRHWQYNNPKSNSAASRCSHVLHVGVYEQSPSDLASEAIPQLTLPRPQTMELRPLLGPKASSMLVHPLPPLLSWWQIPLSSSVLASSAQSGSTHAKQGAKWSFWGCTRGRPTRLFPRNRSIVYPLSTHHTNIIPAWLGLKATALI